jgi:alginate O-acetyltransferase complex protein AlgI
MLFNSIDFLLFFIVVTPLYFALPFKFRALMLLLASCYFYMAFVPIYIVILFCTIVIDYFAGILIENSEGKKRKAWLILSLVSNIGILCYFKYFDFLNENLTALLNTIDIKNGIPSLSILLPIGLSFHTFQAMSYTIEVYRGVQKSERNFITYSLYVMFYPQLVAGPIERPQNVIHQFKVKHTFDYQRVADGLKLMVWGMFKKVVIADRLSEMVDYVYNSPMEHKGFPLIISTVFFSIQIYCDFSGYSDIAIGSARIMGFTLMKNFDRPYASKSIPEFWRRWHISLSTWFKDYLYIPLGGNRVVKWRRYYNLLIVFLISGFWHGASWNFIVWGGIHGILLIIYMLFQKSTKDAIRSDKSDVVLFFTRTASIILVFCLTSFAWIFFRAKTFDDAKHIIKKFFTATKPQFNLLCNGDPDALQKYMYLGTDGFNFSIALISIVVLFFVEYMQSKYRLVTHLSKSNLIFRFGSYSILLLIILYFGVFGKNLQFIYFQF